MTLVHNGLESYGWWLGRHFCFRFVIIINGCMSIVFVYQSNSSYKKLIEDFTTQVWEKIIILWPTWESIVVYGSVANIVYVYSTLLETLLCFHSVLYFMKQEHFWFMTRWVFYISLWQRQRQPSWVLLHIFLIHTQTKMSQSIFFTCSAVEHYVHVMYVVDSWTNGLSSVWKWNGSMMGHIPYHLFSSFVL